MQNETNEIHVRKSADNVLVIEIRVITDSSSTRSPLEGSSERRERHRSDNFEEEMEMKVRRHNK